jgi:hypothetical protein
MTNQLLKINPHTSARLYDKQLNSLIPPLPDCIHGLNIITTFYRLKPRA